MNIVTVILTRDELKALADTMFGNMVKAVVDIDRRLVAVNGEMHADLEALLLQGGSKLESLWGINLYPELRGDDFVEFDSMINVRPSRNNRSRGVEDSEIQKRIMMVVKKMILPRSP